MLSSLIPCMPVQRIVTHPSRELGHADVSSMSCTSIPNALRSLIILCLAVNCEANPSFQPLASGGNGGLVQYWYVGYDPVQDVIIVAHEGTNSRNL